MARYNLIVLLAAVTGWTATNAAPTSSSNGSLYPNIAEVSHTSPEAVDFFRRFFTAKTLRNGKTWVSLFNPNQAEYLDSTLGLTIAANRSQLVQLFCGSPSACAGYTPATNPPGISYPLRILGNTTAGAIVYFEDTTPLYGAEIRTITSFDFVNGTIVRQLDNWDGRGNSFKANTTGDPQYPSTLGLTGIQEKADPKMQFVARKLQQALSAGNATAATALFDHDAVFEDLTLRARVEGRVAIQPYLQRVLARGGLPYGAGAKVTHVLGSAIGGGYEWRPSTGPVKYGITALELGNTGNITRFSAVWDGSVLSQAALQALAEQATTP